MRFPWLVSCGLLAAATLCLAAPDDDTGEVRLWVRATYTGVHTRQLRGHHGGEQPSEKTETRTDRLQLIFAGTSSWRLKDWAPGPSSSNCGVSASGGGSFNVTETGVTGCLKHRGGRFTSIDRGAWSYSVPGKCKPLLPAFSPAGSVVILPNGVWRLVLLCYPNVDGVAAKGNWTQRRTSCDDRQRDDYPIDRENEPPEGTVAASLVADAFNDTLGGTDDQSVDGTWDTDKKGFFASGRIVRRGGEPHIDLGGKAGENTWSGDESRYWTADIQYTVSYDVKPPPVECIIEPGAPHAEWLPAGGADEQTVGNTLGLSARLQVKGEPGRTPLQKGRFRFELADSSTEPGVALNLPLKGAKTDPDLRFGECPGMTPKDQGRVSETTAADVQSASAVVNCYDYGAYGRVRVTCQLTDGSVVYGHLEGQPAREELAVPRDDNNNHVADAWEGTRGGGQADIWDAESEPALDRFEGDGLSLYEEYRGLVHQGAIARLHPALRDLVIVNEMGADAEPGLKLFESASGINVVRLSRGELPADRVVNINSGTGFIAPQHALRLVSEPLAEGIIGISLPDRVKSSPADCDKTVINRSLAFLPDAVRDTLRAVGVAHELGHSLGAQHHGDSGSGTTREDVVINDRGSRIYGVDGTEIATRPYTLHGLVEGKRNGGEASGAQDCIMRNSSYFQWVSQLDRLGAMAYYAVPATAPGNLFCATTAGTGLNAPANTPTCYFGRAANGRGACLTHLRVSDRWGPAPAAK